MNAPGWRAVAALVATITIWASFLVVTRAAMTGRLGMVEVGLIRFGIGGLMFAAYAMLMRRGAGLRNILAPGHPPLWALVGLPLFGGVVFMLFLAAGLRIAPVADSGVFTPSMLPLYVAVLSFLFLGERFTRMQLLGFALIVAGALAVGGWTAVAQGEAGVWRGHLLFTAAALSWAVYTVLFRRSGLSPVDGGTVLCVWAGLGFAALALVYGVDFGAVPPGTLAIQVLFQGVLSGFVATFTFFYAVQALGAARTTAFAALVPVLAALGGWVWLDEPIGWIKGGGIVVVACGVALASGAFSLRQRGVQDLAHRP